MRARAQKRKQASGEAGETSPARPTDAAGPSAEVAAESRAEVEAERPVPDPQQPPVVSPVLMPAVGLEIREDVSALAVATADAERVSITPVVEALMSVTAAARPSPAEAGHAQPASREWGTQTSVAPPLREDETADGDAGAVWRARDEARLLVQSPRRLFFYWRFARDPRELLGEALGSVAGRLSQSVRLVDVSSGEEGEPAPAEGDDYWFDVLPGRLLRADVGFHGDGLPFVRLISSNTVETPAAGVSPVEDEAPEFRVAEPEFERVLEATGFAAGERHGQPARPDEPARTGAPVRPRAGGDTTRQSSSPRDGSHFSNPRGGELF
jgi:hypothetical protein